MSVTSIRPARVLAAAAVAAALATTGTAGAAHAATSQAATPVLHGKQGAPIKLKGKLRTLVRERSARTKMLKSGTWIGPTCFVYNYSNHREALCQWDYVGGGDWITYNLYYADYGSGWYFTGWDWR